MSNALTRGWDPTVTPEVDPWDQWDEVRNQAIQNDNQGAAGGFNWASAAKALGKGLSEMDLSKPAQVKPYVMPRTKFGGRFR